MTKDFEDQVAQRVKEEKQLNYYCDRLPEWAIEGIYKKFAEKEAAEASAKAAKDAADEAAEEAEKQATIRRDQAILDEDRLITEEVERMMLRYGMLHYDKPILELEDEKLEHIFEQNRVSKLTADRDEESIRRRKIMRNIARAERAARRSKKTTSLLPPLTLSQQSSTSRLPNSRPGTSSASRPSTAGSGVGAGDNTTLDLEVSAKTNFDALRRDLHRSRFGGGKSKGKKKQVAHRQVEEPINAFPDIDFQETSDIRVVYGHHLHTLGALAFASELAQGACAFLEEFRFQNCDIRDAGFLRLIQGVRLGNLTSLRVLDLRGNHLTALSVDYFRDICVYGVFTNLEEMLLGNNQLGDSGVDAIIRVMLLGYFRSLYGLHLQRNSITDKGFRALITMVGNIHDRYCPQLETLRLELNLVSPECKHEFSPLPSYVSV